MTSELKTDLRVEVKRVKDKPTECRVFHRGVLVFDGVTRDAILQARPLQGSMDIGSSSLAEMFTQPDEEEVSSPRPGDCTGRWLMTAHSGKAHFLRNAYYFGASTYGTPACGLNDLYVVRSWLSLDPPEAACGTCLRTKDWQWASTHRGKDGLPGNPVSVRH